MNKKHRTIQSIAKRFKVTKTGKVKKMRDSQNHFNAKATGKISRKRRRDLTLSKSDAKVIKSIM
jgi:ribosomal protein L35